MFKRTRQTLDKYLVKRITNLNYESGDHGSTATRNTSQQNADTLNELSQSVMSVERPNNNTSTDYGNNTTSTIKQAPLNNTPIFTDGG